MASEAGGTGGRRGGAETGGILSRVSRRGTQAQENERAGEQELTPEQEPGLTPERKPEAASEPREPKAQERVRGGSRGSAPTAAAPRRAEPHGGSLHTPTGEEYGEWLDGGLRADRSVKSYSAPAMSEHHGDILDEDRKLLKTLGYSRRQVSLGNLMEMAVELQHEYVRRLVSEGGEGPKG